MISIIGVVVQGSLFILLAFAAFCDLHSATIPNRLTYTGIVLGLAFGLWPNVGLELTSCLLGLTVAFLPSILLFSVHSLGGGDVKLLTAVGALVGYPVILDVLFYSILVGCSLGLIMLIIKGRCFETLRGLNYLLVGFVVRNAPKIVPAQDLHIPFGLAIALGTLWALYKPFIIVSTLAWM